MTSHYPNLGSCHIERTSLPSMCESPVPWPRNSADDWYAARSMLQALPDDQLTAQVARLNQDKSVVEAELLFYLGELDARQLYREYACPSLFDYLMSRLGQTEDVAYKWKWGARLVREFPLVYQLISTGRLSLSVLMLLKPHLTPDNHVDWLLNAAGKSKRAVEKMVASRHPKPDTPAQIRVMPHPTSTRPHPTEARNVPEAVLGQTALQPASTLESSSEFSSHAAMRQATSPANFPQIPNESTPMRTSPSSKTSSLHPLSACSYRVVFTACERLKQKIDCASELASHVVAPNDLAALFERALDRLIESEQRRRCGSSRSHPVAIATARDATARDATARDATARDATARPARRSRRIPAAVRREVWQRDAGQCSYVDEQGRRCHCRHFLEFDHLQAYAMGGSPTVENIRLLCSAHNALAAERVFGKGRIANAIGIERLKTTSRQVEATTAAD